MCKYLWAPGVYTVLSCCLLHQSRHPTSRERSLPLSALCLCAHTLHLRTQDDHGSRPANVAPSSKRAVPCVEHRTPEHPRRRSAGARRAALSCSGSPARSAPRSGSRSAAAQPTGHGSTGATCCGSTKQMIIHRQGLITITITTQIVAIGARMIMWNSNLIPLRSGPGSGWDAHQGPISGLSILRECNENVRKWTAPMVGPCGEGNEE